MRNYINIGKKMLLSATAKDTFVLFAGNLSSAFLGFLFTLIVARALSVSDFGIFSAALNLVVILMSLADVGISSGSISFVSELLARGEKDKANEYVKAAFVIRLIVVVALSLVVFVFAPVISSNFLATSDPSIAVWTGVLSLFLFPVMFFPYILQAKNEFLKSTVVDNSFYAARFLFALAFLVLGGFSMGVAFFSYSAGFLFSLVLSLIFLKTKFFLARPGKIEYKKLIGFSGWLGVNRIISSFSGKLDVQMLAAMSGGYNNCTNQT